ncbi:acetolactate synthase [Virgibacillus phasianinus]|uniref:Acetolactate synthase n=1 Tax=Virgibacillus phasianinus TaxID=2017483 RepID=A0A220U960_9BACI|nr:thiamine pyrophosphate-dependent enzyme [Virgibacillus phasianinus]ASK64263.1 acetolactate synthase [Virgibacillus phasianinus]
MTGAQAIVECMKLEGITRAFCVPGESYLPLLDALHDEDSIQVVAARHEGGAAFIAEGYAKATLAPGVVMATRGVGAANLSIGVHTAYQDSTPMVVFLGQVHSKFRGREGFQEIDLDQFFGHITKWAVEVNDTERMPEIVQRAFRIAKTGRPGPVIVSLPENVLPAEEEMSFGPPTIMPKPAPSNEEIERVETMLNGARNPLIIAGGGVKSAEAEDELRGFAEKFSIPVIAAFRRHDVFPNNHALYGGHLGLGTSKEVLQTVKDADVILAIGTRLSEVTTQDYKVITADKKLIHIDIDYASLGKVYAPELGILADSGEALKKLRDITCSGSWGNWARERNEAYKQISQLSTTNEDVINKQIIALLEKRLPKDAVLTNDAGNFAGWLHSFYPFIKSKTYVGPTSGAMGYGMPAALGVKLGSPGKTVVSLSGDGGFMMTANELETAVRYRIPVISLVFNNNMYGTIRMHQEIHYPKKVMATNLGDVSFSKLAESVGANGYTVSTAQEFERALDKALHNQGPTVIEIITGQENISVSSTIQQLRDR